MTLLQEIRGSVDIAGVGIPFIIEEDMRLVRGFKQYFPETEILADVKIMDTGELETETAFRVDADIVTVLGASNDEAIPGVVKAMKEYNGKIMIDTIAVKDLEARVREIDTVGVDHMCAHMVFGVQQTGKNPPDELMTVNRVIIHAEPAVTDGVKFVIINAVASEGAAVIVVGGAIYSIEDRAAAAKEMKQHLKQEETGNEQQGIRRDRPTGAYTHTEPH